MDFWPESSSPSHVHIHNVLFRGGHDPLTTLRSGIWGADKLPWVMVIPNAINIFNGADTARVDFMYGIPKELEEAP